MQLLVHDKNEGDEEKNNQHCNWHVDDNLSMRFFLYFNYILFLLFKLSFQRGNLLFGFYCLSF
jgi:hypothetical protein